MEERAQAAEVEVARLLVKLARRTDASPTQDAANVPPDAGVAAAWDGIAEACEQIADHARFMSERAGGVRWKRPTPKR